MSLRVGVLVVFCYFAVASLLLGQTPEHCGRTEAYEDHNPIGYGPLRISQIRGAAQDDFGAPVHVCVFLFSEGNHKLVLKTEGKDSGQFELVGVPFGRYRLVVKGDGFCTANAPLIVESKAKAKRITLHMRCCKSDACSYGAIE